MAQKQLKWFVRCTERKVDRVIQSFQPVMGMHEVKAIKGLARIRYNPSSSSSNFGLGSSSDGSPLTVFKPGHGVCLTK